LGEIILGSVVGIVVAVEDELSELTSPGWLVLVATAMLDPTESDLALSVPVGLILWGAVVESAEDVTKGVTESVPEVLAIAGVIAGVVLFAVMGAGGAEELSVDTGTTETPVFDVGSEVGLGVTDGTVELTLGAAEGAKDEVLETLGGSDVVLDAVKDATTPVAEVPWLTAEVATEVPWLTTELATEVPWSTTELATEVPWLTTELATEVPWLTTKLVAEVPWLTAELAADVTWLMTEPVADVTWLVRELTNDDSPASGSLVVVVVVVAEVPGSVLVPVLVPVAALVSVGSLVVVVVPVADDCPSEPVVVLPPVVVVVDELPAPTVTPTDTDTETPVPPTDTAPPTTTVSDVVSLEETVFAVEVGAVVLRNGPTCLLISLGK
jgi:hypothetical protein